MRARSVHLNCRIVNMRFSSAAPTRPASCAGQTPPTPQKRVPSITSAVPCANSACRLRKVVSKGKSKSIAAFGAETRPAGSMTGISAPLAPSALASQLSDASSAGSESLRSSAAASLSTTLSRGLPSALPGDKVRLSRQPRLGPSWACTVDDNHHLSISTRQMSPNLPPACFRLLRLRV